jgi:phosphoglycerate dehydrogenase-like enzyme
VTAPVASKPVVTIAIHPDHSDGMLAAADLAALSRFAEVRTAYLAGPVGIAGELLPDPAGEAALVEIAAGCTALVVTHGAPRINGAVLAALPSVTFVGELEGDRFCTRIDTVAAAERGVVVVDTTHGSSLPVAEWALALAILGLRDAGRYVRALIGHQPVGNGGQGEPARLTNRELTGKRVGLIGFGHIGWRLVELLRPFDADVVAFDPYAPRELADAAGISFARLDTVMNSSDVVCCLAPLTPGTRGLVTGSLLASMRPGSVFVNVSRGAVVDRAGLHEAAAHGEVVFCLDVLEDEPIPVDHLLRDLPNVLLTPHLAGTTEESRFRFFALMVDELRRHLHGLEPHAQITADTVAGRRGRDVPKTKRRVVNA